MTMEISDVEEFARRCRVEIVKMVHRAQAGHPGGSLSEIDLISALYTTRLRVKPNEPKWNDRDRFILLEAPPAIIITFFIQELLN